MSQFIDRLKQIAQAAPKPMGFRSVEATSSKQRMLLVASLVEADIGGMSGHVVGADAGLLPVSELGSEARALGEAAKAVSDITWGARLKETGEEAIAQIVKAGGDFVVFGIASAVVPEFQGGAVGRVLEVEASLDDGLLRTVNKLPVDAVLITAEQRGDRFLSWYYLMRIQRCADLLSKPLLVSMPSDVAANDLQALWDVGVDGVAVSVGGGQPAGGLMALRQVIDGLPPVSKRKRGETAALLPYTSSGIDSATEEPEED